MKSTQRLLGGWERPGLRWSLALVIALGTFGAAASGISAQQPEELEAAFTLSADSGLVPLIVTTTNESVGAESFHWDFDDGGTSDEREPRHIYVRPGLFVVELEACRGADCATATQVVNVTGRDEVDGGAVKDGGRVYGSINQPGDVDEWTFEGSAGSFVTIELAPDTGSPVDPVLRLFGPDGALVAFNDDVGAGAQAEIGDLELAQSGEYTIEAGAFLDTVGVYSLTLEVTAADAVRAVFRLSPSTGIAPLDVTFTNDSRNATSSSWEFGDGATSSTSNPRHRFAAGGVFEVRLTACRGDECDVAHVTVVVEADDGGAIGIGETIVNRLDFEDDVDRFTFEASAGAEVTIDLVAEDDGFDALLFLFGPDGEEVATDDDGGEGLNSRIAALILSESGEYSIDAQAFPGGGTGAYTLTLQLDPEPVVRAAVEVDAGSFVAPATVTFRDASLGGVTSWTWRLDGAEVGQAATLVHTFEETGTFVVSLEACNVRSCDGWSVQLRISADLDGGPIGANQTVFGTIDQPGDSDDWTFDAVAGQTVTISAVAVGDGLDAALELRRPDGTILLFDDDSGGDLNPLIENVTLEESGEFTIRVRSFDADGTGAYRLELSVR